MTSVFSNMQSLLRLYGTFPGIRYSGRVQGLSLCDCGTGSAYESYALIDPERTHCPPDDLRGLILAGLGFFDEGARPHIWPLFPGTDPVAGRLLEESGAARDAVFFDMSARSDAMSGYAAGDDAFEAADVFEPDDVRAWADAVWYGFDSGAPAPVPFVRFASCMAACRDIFLCGVRVRDADAHRFAATGILALAGGSAGIYDIATRPEYRRRGAAMSVMKTLMAAAGARGHDRVALLATPAGRPLYEKCGFDAGGRVDIYRLGDA
jgi:GNAT superfamily N-acetyltransferase